MSVGSEPLSPRKSYNGSPIRRIVASRRDLEFNGFDSEEYARLSVLPMGEWGMEQVLTWCAFELPAQMADAVARQLEDGEELAGKRPHSLLKLLKRAGATDAQAQALLASRVAILAEQESLMERFRHDTARAARPGAAHALHGRCAGLITHPTQASEPGDR